jgi:hypothetical protein
MPSKDHLILDLATNLTTYSTISKEEMQTREADQLRLDSLRQEKAEARSAAEAKLIELGLTVEDLKALLG